jgi:hypothetical protein
MDTYLAGVVEGIAAVDLAYGAGLQHPGDLGEGGLEGRSQHQVLPDNARGRECRAGGGTRKGRGAP